ncbi:MAG: tRNA lysidine(34) synthetase TilS [Firmicutes bacterium]|nr:tRNA lysidine(34) synthetase TilS [Bacillota bacterium]
MDGAVLDPKFDILPDVLATIKKHNMLQPGVSVVVGVSGGIDSTALLHVLWRLRDSWNLKLYIAHLNHGIRGEDAAADAQLVEVLGAKLGIPVYVKELNIPEIARQTGRSEEEAGRIARYQLYEELADEVGASRIAVGHHGDDQAETVLMNLIRGAGLRGLSGIPPVRGRVIRPLIELEKWQLEAYCRSWDLPWREDVTNWSTAYRRNYIRWEIIPKLKQLNPGAVRRIMQTADTLSEDWQLLAQLAQEAFGRAALEVRPGQRVSLNLTELIALPAAIRKRVTAYAYTEVAQGTHSLTAASLEYIEKCIAGQASVGQRTLPGDVDVFVRDEVLIFARRVDIERDRGFGPCPLPLGSSTIIADAGISVQLQVLTTVIPWWEEDSALQPRAAWQELGVWWADMDLASLELPLYARSRRSGDRFQPLGMSGSKKLKDLFIDEKIPRELRNKIPCIIDGKGIVAVVGLHQDQRTRVTDQTKQVLRITAEKV